MDNVTGAGNNCSTSFVVEYSEDCIVLIWARSSPVTDMSCVIKGLDPFLDYVLHVIGINSFGQSAPTDLIVLEGKCYIFFLVLHIYISTIIMTTFIVIPLHCMSDIIKFNAR